MFVRLAFLAAAAAAALIAPILAEPRNEDVERAREFYRAQPRYFQPVMQDARVPGLSDLRAASCGMCHQAIYEEWKASTHARAWKDDAQFQEELAKHVGGEGKPDAAWMCVNCHTPFEAQLERLVVGLEDGDLGKPQYVKNPAFDPRLQLEAITCAACHVRDGYIIGPYGDTRAPHPVKKGEVLLTSEACTDCHQANAYLEDVNLACMFDTGLEHAATDAAKQGETCQSCHMPEVFRPVSNFPPTPAKKGRRHFFGGSLIPKKPEYQKDVDRMRPFFKDGMTAEWVDLPQTVAAGATIKIRFALKNEHSGHLLPTGDPERFITVKVTASDDTGAALGERSEFIGAKYQWDPVKKLSDSRLAAKERREYELEFVAPKSGAVKLKLDAGKYRINEENFAYHKLEGRYVAGVPFLALEATIPVE
jgi:Cytochrome c554 and c-prime